MKTFENFLPLVSPSLSGCPHETMVLHIRGAAIEFCKRAHVWREDLPTLLADGFSVAYELALDDQVDLAKLLTVDVRDASTTPKYTARIVEPLAGRDAQRNGCTELIAWTDDRHRVSVYPPPISGARIDVLAAIKPALTAFSFHDNVFAHHAEDIAEGALWRLKRMTGADIEWSDVIAAEMHRAEFEKRIATAAAQASRGFARRARDKSERFF